MAEGFLDRSRDRLRRDRAAARGGGYHEGTARDHRDGDGVDAC